MNRSVIRFAAQAGHDEPFCGASCVSKLSLLATAVHAVTAPTWW